ncbi:MAG: hypothetical protein LUD38_07455, partial [Parabacteroides sp.]|nr:hypothetical protein [Parabacteroides sp.]
VDVVETFGDAFADDDSIKFANNTISSGLFSNANGGALSITTNANGYAELSSELAAVLGKGGKLEVEVVNADPNGTTPANVDFTFNLKAYDKDGKLVASLDNYTNSTDTQGIAVNANRSITFASIGTTDAGLNAEYFKDLSLDLSAVTRQTGQGGVLIGAEKKATLTVSEVKLDSSVATNTKKTTTVDLTSLNPSNATKVDTSKYYSARKIDLTVDAELKNNANEAILIDIKGQLANIEKFDKAMAGNDPRIEITANIKSELNATNVTPTTYTVTFGGIELSSSWNGQASTFNFEGAEGTALEGLNFSIENKTSNNINHLYTFANQIDSLSFDTNGGLSTVDDFDVLNTSDTSTIFSKTSGTGTATIAGDDIKLDLTGMSKEMQAYLANGYELKVEVYDLLDAQGAGGAKFINNGLAGVGLTVSTAAALQLRFSLSKDGEDSIIEYGSVAFSAATATAAGKIAASTDVKVSNSLFGNIKIDGTGATAGIVGAVTGASDAFEVELTTKKSNTLGLADARETASGISTETSTIDRGQFFDALTASTVGKGASVVGGMSHNDDASRTAGTIAVFGNTIAKDGSGAVERGITNVQFKQTTERNG